MVCSATVNPGWLSMKLLLLTWLIFAAAAAYAATSDKAFLAARNAFRHGDAQQLHELAQDFRGSLLEPYLDYYQLKLKLHTVKPAEIRRFLDRRPEDTPLIDKLRGEWLAQLGKDGKWKAFDREYPRLEHRDTGLECYELQSRRRTDERKALLAARRLWFSGRSQPDSCTILFDAALKAGIISEQDIWRRLRLTLQAGHLSLARHLVRLLPKKTAPRAVSLRRAYNDPERYLARAHLRKASRGEREVALFALQRLAMQLPDLAYRRWRKIAKFFPQPERRYFYAWQGYEAARNHDAHALEWYRMAGKSPLN